MQYLAAREHSYLELYQKLSQKDFTRAEIEQALAGLIDDNLLSDLRFGEAFVRSRVGKGQGPVRIRQELKAKGLEDAQIDLAFKANDVDWEKVLETTWSKKFSYMDNGDAALKLKQWRFLQYRGFTQSQISQFFRLKSRLMASSE